MLLVRLLVGRLMPTSLTVTGGTLMALLLMWTQPKRKSLTRVGENRWVSATDIRRSSTGRSKGKFRSEPLMLPPSEACRPPAPKGTSCSELEKKKRYATLSLPPRNSRSQLVVNWSSVKRPGLLKAKGPVLRLPALSKPAWPGTLGKRYPPGVFKLIALKIEQLQRDRINLHPGLPREKSIEQRWR